MFRGRLRRAVARRQETDGYTIRDIGEVLGVSYQRVHQITH
ncbi:sigma factor-like helix-turn-helix DNA-binding protein [Cryobacterium sp. TMB1-7]